MNITDLHPETLAKLGLTKEAVKPREYTFTTENRNAEPNGSAQSFRGEV